MNQNKKIFGFLSIFEYWICKSAFTLLRLMTLYNGAGGASVTLFYSGWLQLDVPHSHARQKT